MTQVKRILKYVNGTSDYGIMYYHCSDSIKEIERSYDCIVETIEQYEKNFVKPKVQYDNPQTKIANLF